ncbi:MAG: hypothetical protein GY726_04390 [Proteobacteria bacterium]|nr:hypothetical protein [Pseudomonadota bacterium]
MPIHSKPQLRETRLGCKTTVLETFLQALHSTTREEKPARKNALSDLDLAATA